MSIAYLSYLTHIAWQNQPTLNILRFHKKPTDKTCYNVHVYIMYHCMLFTRIVSLSFIQKILQTSQLNQHHEIQCNPACLSNNENKILKEFIIVFSGNNGHISHLAHSSLRELAKYVERDTNSKL